MPKQPTPLQSFYRLTVMLGALVVGSMAAYRYGPAPERLASMIDATVARINEMQGQLAEQGTKESPVVPTIAAPVVQETTPVWSSNAATLPASPPVQPTIAGGTENVTVEPIGERRLAYRATGSAAGPGGLVRRYDAIAETPEQAELAVLHKMSAARRGG